MQAYYLDWANLLLRWLHVITAIAWVGSSFYFVFLDSSLTPPVDEKLRREGVTEAAGRLQQRGFISYRRGHISVLDRAGLEGHVCECYGVVKKEFARLLSDVRQRQGS